MFAQTSAATAAASSTAAPPVSARKNSRSGVWRFRAHAVRPEKRGSLTVTPASLAPGTFRLVGTATYRRRGWAVYQMK
jgi:hypothetical protein